MPRGLDLIVFDWDGTLLDSAAAVVASMRAACRDLGLPEPEEARARHVIGLGRADALTEIASGLHAEDVPRLVERCRYHCLARDSALALFPGTREMLSGLESRGHRMAIATGTSHSGLMRALQQTGIGGHFLATRTADRSAPKPAPDMLLELMDELGAAPDRTLMIGDTTHDLEMARHAGVAAVAVAQGAHARYKLENLAPRAVLRDTHELDAWLRHHG